MQLLKHVARHYKKEDDTKYEEDSKINNKVVRINKEKDQIKEPIGGKAL